MSLLLTYLVDDCAIKFGDPQKTRVTLDEWLLFYNQSGRDLCQKADVLQFRSRFNLTTEAYYPYPSEMTQMTKLEVTDAPSDDNTFRELAERFEDEFRSDTDRQYPTGGLPDRYFADKAGFWLVPRPTAQILLGGRITYFAIPDRVLTLTGALYQLPEFTQDYVIRRMIIYAKMARHRVAEANADLQQWYADVEGLQDKIEDRSNDRRSGLRTRRNRYAGMS